MFKKITLLIAVVLMIGCSNGINIDLGSPEIPAGLCQEYDIEKSLLMKVANERGIPLNELYYGFLDATSIAVIFEAIDKERLKKFMVDLGTWYTDHYPVSYTTLISYMADQEKAQALGGILNRRIGVYNSYLMISKYDDCLLRAGWKNAMQELYLE